MAKKIKVGVVFGGRSGEHEVSLRSAHSVIANLDKKEFEIVPIGISKDGEWHLQHLSECFNSKESALKLKETNVLPQWSTIDVAFPVVHGSNCEDGTLQGFFEQKKVAYVGCGVLSSAICMDKEIAKKLCALEEIPVVPYVFARPWNFEKNYEGLASLVDEKIKYPCFVKPSGGGSSLGVTKVKTKAGLKKALKEAFLYDEKVLIEKAIDAREIEISALESLEEEGKVLTSVAGEIIPSHEFYSYDAKYVDAKGADLKIPAELTKKEMEIVQRLAGRIFETLECSGMARVDFFLDRKTNKFYFNEINTLPGFTSISMYPKMWAASGMSYSALLTHLVHLAGARAYRRASLRFEK